MPSWSTSLVQRREGCPCEYFIKEGGREEGREGEKEGGKEGGRVGDL